jgi:hypothetical protein
MRDYLEMDYAKSWVIVISARQLEMSIFKPTNTLTIGQVSGVMNYQNNFIRVENMNLTQLMMPRVM